MSRIEDEWIAYIGRNRSGQYSGELEWTLNGHRFELLSTRDLKELSKTCSLLLERINEQIPADSTKENNQKLEP